jgi:hypothetical protein
MTCFCFVFTDTMSEWQVMTRRQSLAAAASSATSYIIDTLCELTAVMKIGIVATTSYNPVSAVC